MEPNEMEVSNIDKIIRDRWETDFVTIDLYNDFIKVGKEIYKAIPDKKGNRLFANLSWEDVQENLNNAYWTYAHSVPTKRESNKERHSYFKALSINELSEEDLMVATDREWSRLLLEMTVLLLKVDGYVEPKNLGWYWKSSKYPDFVILKDWICEK